MKTKPRGSSILSAPRYSKKRIRQLLAAQKAVSTTDRLRLKWLIKFVNTDFQSPQRTPDELDEVDHQILAFIYRGTTIPPITAKGAGWIDYEPRSAQAITALRNSAGFGLREVAKIPDNVAGPLVGWDVNEPDDEGNRPLVERRVRKGFSVLNGPRRAVFLAAVADLIASEEGHRIKQCAAEDCGEIFYKWKRGMYCSSRCAGRARIRRFRQEAK